MHNNYIERECNMHNCAYAVGVHIGYHCPKCFEHDIVVDVHGLRKTPLKILELGFNMSFDDMTTIEVTYLFCSWVTFTLAIWVCWVFVIRSRIYEEVLNVLNFFYHMCIVLCVSY